MFRSKLGVFIRILAACGLLLFLGSIGLGIYLATSHLYASVLTSPTQYQCGDSPPPCPAPLLTTALNLSISDSTVSLSQTDALTARFDYWNYNPDPQTIPLTVTLVAPEFNFTPAISERATSFPEGSGTLHFGWVLSPTKPGTFKVGVQVEVGSHPYTDIRYVGITVTDVFGLNPWEIQLLSYLGTFLGPLLTIAWWYDKWQERKRRRSNNASLASPTKPSKSKRKARHKR